MPTRGLGEQVRLLLGESFDAEFVDQIHGLGAHPDLTTLHVGVHDGAASITPLCVG